MNRYTIKLLCFFLILSFVAGYEVVFSGARLPRAAVYLYYYAFAAGVLSWLYLALRLFFFNRNLSRFVDRMLDNEYSAGITMSKLCNDEVSAVSRRINTLSEQLAAYDNLQRDRIAVLSCALQLVCGTVKECVAVFDRGTKELRLNPAFRAVFAVEEEVFSLDSITGQQGNRAFLGLLASVTEKGDIISNVHVRLCLPIRCTQRKLVVSMIPVKNRNETVEVAVIFASVPE